jgi:DNA repair exonuclease SbcCD ATPase subunit
MSKLVFKSEGERNNAYNEIPDIENAPPGVKLEDFREEMEKKLQDIDDAIIDPTGTVTPENNDNIDDIAVIDYKPLPELEVANTRINSLQQERADMLATFEREKADLLNNIKKLQDKPVEKKPDLKINPPAEINKEIAKKNDEIKSIQTQIDELEEAMNDIDDPEDADVHKAMLKTTQLTSRLNRLMSEKHNIELEDNRRELAELRNNQTKESERLKTKQDEDARLKSANESRNKTLKIIDEFRNNKNYTEFKSKKTFEEMEDEYANFSLGVAMADTGKFANEVTPEESERAVQRYLEKTPLLVQKVREKGIKEPADLGEFLVISDVNALRMGVKLNKKTGQWVELRDEDNRKINFPDINSAYDYYKKGKGVTGQDIVNAERKGSQNMLNAINQRADMKELNEAHQSETVEHMDMEAATKIVDEWNEEEIIQLARKDMNSKKVQMYNKALVTMGLDPIEEGF